MTMMMVVVMTVLVRVPPKQILRPWHGYRLEADPKKHKWGRESKTGMAEGPTKVPRQSGHCCGLGGWGVGRAQFPWEPLRDSGEDTSELPQQGKWVLIHWRHTSLVVSFHWMRSPGISGLLCLPTEQSHVTPKEVLGQRKRGRQALGIRSCQSVWGLSTRTARELRSGWRDMQQGVTMMIVKMMMVLATEVTLWVLTMGRARC